MNAKQGLGYPVVHKLTRPLVGKNHHVFIDNFFSSIPLAENLLWEKIYLCRTVHSNRQGIPREIKPTTQRVKRLWQGESLFLQNGNLVITVWKDKKPAYFLSTQLNPVGTKNWTGGSMMEARFKCRLFLLSNRTTTWAGWTKMINFAGTKWQEASLKNGGIAFCDFLSTSVLSISIFWRNCPHFTGTELSLLFALTWSRIWSAIFRQGNCLLVQYGLKEDTGLYPTAKVTVSIAWSKGKLLGTGSLVSYVTNAFVWIAFEIIPQRILRKGKIFILSESSFFSRAVFFSNVFSLNA